MNEEQFTRFRNFASNLLINRQSAILCPSCDSEVSRNELVEMKGFVRCVICLK